MTEAIQNARRLIAVVQLENVRLVEAVAKTGVRSREEAGEALFHHSARAPHGIHDGVFYVLASLEVRVTSAQVEETKPSLHLKVEFELKYKVPSDFRASKAEVSNFAKVNAIYNAWPYFREYVHTTTQRMNLAPLILPV